MAAADLGDGPGAVAAQPPVRVAAAAPVTPPTISRGGDIPRPVQQIAVPPSIAAAEAAVAEAMRATGTESPATAGADFARAQRVAVNTGPAPRPARDVAQVTPAPAGPRAATPQPAADGPWKLQLGAFSVPGNAERAWAQVAGKAALAGRASSSSRQAG